MKRIILIIGIALLSGVLAAQSDEEVFQGRFNEALWYMKGASRPYFPEKGLLIIQELANAGFPKAMNALGIMYGNGIGTSTDYSTSLHWFTKASEAGYLRAFYNIGMIYKYGYGVKNSDYEAMNYFLKGSELGDPDCIYVAGYMYYKGLGCKQDYKQALKLFFQAADLGNSGASYMIGLCYRNGYGVEQDEDKALEWLKLSSTSGNYRATMELATEKPENSISKGEIRTSQHYDVEIPKSFTEVNHNTKNKFNSDTFEGYIITYDWSGENAISISPLILNLTRKGSEVTGQWIESDTIIVDLKANLTDTTLTFIDVDYSRSDHYSAEPFNWEFVKASIKVDYADSVVFLAGNLQLFSPITMEPEKPTYISLKSTVGKTPGHDKKTNSEMIQDLVAFPNPFDDNLSLSFSLQNGAEVMVLVNTLSGLPIYEATYGKLLPGPNVMPLPLNVPRGMYLISVRCGSFQRSVAVVKP